MAASRAGCGIRMSRGASPILAENCYLENGLDGAGYVAEWQGGQTEYTEPQTSQQQGSRPVTDSLRHPYACRFSVGGHPYPITKAALNVEAQAHTKVACMEHNKALFRWTYRDFISVYYRIYDGGLNQSWRGPAATAGRSAATTSRSTLLARI
eukprot:5176466-Pleurochrysis_carterae.AAC.1